MTMTLKKLLHYSGRLRCFSTLGGFGPQHHSHGLRSCVLLICLSLLNCLHLSAQTLFTYGPHAVSREDFLHSYHKNLNPAASEKISYETYLDLYSKFKIKVQAALDARMDTLASQRMELAGFRDQLAESYLKDDAGVQLLTEEAARRSLKDIDLSFIYIPFEPDGAAANMKALSPLAATPSDTAAAVAAASRQIETAYQALQNGEPFHKVASTYTASPDLGYITAFVLPYELENLAYNTPPGTFSAPFRAANGFYIFRNNGERKAVGQIRTAQILLAFPPGVTEAQQATLAARADSLYEALREGADFAALATAFSDDNLTYRTGGEMPAFGVGYYDPLFETTAFGLAKDGDIAPPLRTAYGYHILKRLQRIPVIEDPQQPDWLAVVRERVLQSDRMQVTRATLLKNIRDRIGNDASPEVLDNDTDVITYYRDHLEQYNAGFAQQLEEFKQGNLLFGIMQEKVWDPAAEDSAGQRQYYDSHPEKYYWENSADALLFTVSDKTEAAAVRTELADDPSRWRKLAELHSSVLQADSGRFELGQLPVTEKTRVSEGLTTAPVTSGFDNSLSFVHIIRIYPERERKNFEDARGSVISDYQDQLEKAWMEKLLKKYPLRIKKKVLRKLPPV